MRYCNSCGDPFAPLNLNHICHYCATRPKCEECGANLDRNQNCQDCGGYCIECDQYAYHDELFHDYQNNGYVCMGCYEEIGSKTQFFGTKKTKFKPVLYMGVEVEVENCGKKGTYSTQTRFNTDFTYTSGDGSLDNGFEIKTRPATFWWLKENEDKLAPIFALAKEGFKAYDTRTCGMHIHLDKRAFSEGQLYKFSEFVYASTHRKFVTKIAQRDGSTWAKYIKPYTGVGRLGYSARAGSKKKKAMMKKEHWEKYRAVSQSRGTIECRLFKGNLSARGFWRNVEFCHSLYLFAGETSIRENTSSKYYSFVGDNRGIYPYLWKFINREGVRKLCV